MRGEELTAAAASSELRLCVELPAFPHAVLYQQIPTLAAVVAAAGGGLAGGSTMPGTTGSSSSINGGIPSAATSSVAAAGSVEGDGGTLESVVLLNDTEVCYCRTQPGACGSAAAPVLTRLSACCC